MLFNNKVFIERDSKNKEIEDKVFSKLADIVKPHTVEQPEKSSVKFVGIEDAIKELLEIEKTGQRN